MLLIDGVLIVTLQVLLLATFHSPAAASTSSFNKCNIPKINVAQRSDKEETIRTFPTVPTIFVGSPHRNRRLSESSSKKRLRELHGNTIVTLASSNTYSHDTIDMTLSEYLDIMERNAHLSENSKANETYYLFGNNFADVFKSLEGEYKLPPCEDCKIAGATTIGIGGRRSGVSFHFHGPGFSEVISGRKQFFLYPPHSGIDVPSPPNMTMSQWVDTVYPLLKHQCGLRGKGTAVAGSLKNEEYDEISENNVETCSESAADEFYECVLEPGDMLYFPDKWQHATLNLDSYNVFVSLFLDLQLLATHDV